MAFLRCTLIFSEAQPRVQLENLCENKRRDGSIRSLTAKRAGTSRRTSKVCTLFSLILGKFRLLFFSTTTFIFSRSLYIISLPYWWIARAKYTPSPYVHASRARLNTCTSSSVRVHIAPPAFLPSFLCRLPC